MIKSKNLFHAYKPAIYNFFKNRNYPTLNINSNFMEKITDKNFFMFEECKTIKVYLEDKKSYKFFDIKSKENLIGEVNKLIDKVVNCKKTCILFHRSTFKVDIIYCIPIFKREEPCGTMYGEIENLYDLSFIDSPVIIDLDNSSIVIDKERIFLENIKDLDLVSFIAKYYYSPERDENIYIISTKQSTYIYKKENLDISLTYERLSEIYSHSDHKRIIIDNKYKIMFCDLNYGYDFYIIAKVYHSNYNLDEIMKVSFAV